MKSNIHTGGTLVFQEASYPQALTEALYSELVPGAFTLCDAAGLARALESGAYGLLVSFHGPYFPKAAWRAILRFLEAGGKLALFGGMPFTRPVESDGDVEPEQDSYTKQLYLGPVFQVSLKEYDFRLVAAGSAAFLADCSLALPAGQPGTFWACYPKLTQASDHPEDLGSAGPIDTVLTPLLFVEDASSGNRLATPAFLLDQRQGRFQGGRWLISAWQPASEAGWRANAEAIRRLIRLVQEGPQTIEVRPELACYRAGEAPALLLSARTGTASTASLKVYGPRRESMLQTFELDIPPSPVLYEVRLPLAPVQEPGLYRVEMLSAPVGGQSLRQESGFWLWDEALVKRTRGRRLTAGRDYFYSSGELFPVCGTTYMDSRVQRRFLTLPNPARWHRDFAEMKAAGINLVRTGIWTAWREFMPLAGVANEVALRALDAFVLTACAHDMHVIFTFFAFFPPLFEGENPWLDPRSLQAQQDFVAVLARRYASVELLAWDLINEPSFGDPRRIFAKRPIPHYDRFELAAFRRWLAARYTLSELQLRWRQTPADLPGWEQVRPPDERDYNTHLGDTTSHNMLKVADYTLFSQEMFNGWATRMYETIRACGSQTLIGVGQDEAGARISPQFYAASVDYTTTHPWWNNDALLWDMLLDKTPLKPNLVEETGIMLVRDVDGRPFRSEQENADLLERKCVLSLAARSAGMVQWLWHTNAYMTSDNENSIGLVRADGSGKPELAVIQAFGQFMQALAPQMVEPPAPPPVWVVIPYSQWFARPELAVAATQQAVRVLGYGLGMIPQLVGEHQLSMLSTLAQPPRTIIVPAVQLFDEAAWRALQRFVFAGGTLLVSGVISRSPHNLPFDPLLPPLPETDVGAQLIAPGAPGELPPRPVSRYEELQVAPGETCTLVYDGDKIGYVRKAHNQLRRYAYGTGTLLWCGLPLELSSNAQATATVYRQALDLNGQQGDGESPLLVVRHPLKDGSLVLVVSESGSARQVLLAEGLRLEVAPNRAGALIIRQNQVVYVSGGIRLLEGEL